MRVIITFIILFHKLINIGINIEQIKIYTYIIIKPIDLSLSSEYKIRVDN